MAQMEVVSENIESKNKTLGLEPSTRCSTVVTMQSQTVSGRLTIFIRAEVTRVVLALIRTPRDPFPE
jgi:hypothetical protein